MKIYYHAITLFISIIALVSCFQEEKAISISPIATATQSKPTITVTSTSRPTETQELTVPRKTSTPFLVSAIEGETEIKVTVIPPTVTPTRVPLNLEKQTWTAEPVLFQYNRSACVDVCSESFSALPDLILYADGQLIQKKYIDGHSQLMHRQLSIADTCAILHTIDHIGYFNYDDTKLREANLQHPRLTNIDYIEVNSWKAGTIQSGGMGDFLPGESISDKYQLDDTLFSMYLLLGKGHWGASDPYPISQIVVRLYKITESYAPFVYWEDKGTWENMELSLADLYEKGLQNSPDMSRAWTVLEGNGAVFLYNFFDQGAYPRPIVVEENGIQYEIEIRAMLPYENINSIQTSYGNIDIIPAPDIEYDKTSLTCLPEHGVLDIYYELPASKNK